MITVYFETKNYSEVVATFADDDTFMACLPALEALAKQSGMIVSESVNDDCPKFEPAKEEI
jgi:hypothetical protein